MSRDPNPALGRSWSTWPATTARCSTPTAGPIRLMAEMTTVGYKDIWKMGQVGSTPAAAVTCLFDTLHGSYLVEVRKGNGMANSVVQALPAVNMGDPENLRDFIVRSIDELSCRALCAGAVEPRARLARRGHLRGCQARAGDDPEGRFRPCPSLPLHARPHERRRADATDRLRRLEQGLPGHRRAAPGARPRRRQQPAAGSTSSAWTPA